MEKNITEMNRPRTVGRAAIQSCVPADQWKENWDFTQQLKEYIHGHRICRHPLIGLLNSEKLNVETTTKIHLEFAYAFAQIFTDSIIFAMAHAGELEPRLGPVGKASARFLFQLNLLDELGYAPATQITEDYSGNPYLAHYVQFAETMKQLGTDPMEIVRYKASSAAEAARRTFTDQFNNYLLVTTVLACAESVFSLFAGPWSMSVKQSTHVDTSKGYHSIHVEDNEGHFLDDEHSEDSWYLFCQAVTKKDHEIIRDKVEAWLDVWYDFADNIMHIARTMNPKK